MEEKAADASCLTPIHLPCGACSCIVKGGGKVDQVGGSIAGLRLSTFRENVRLSVQKKCHLSNPGSYQMSMPLGLLATGASVDFRHRCIALRCLRGDPTLLPSCEWTCPRAWPTAPRPIGLVEETSATWVKWSPSSKPRLYRRGRSRGGFLRLPLSVARGPFPEAYGGLQGLETGWHHVRKA